MMFRNIAIASVTALGLSACSGVLGGASNILDAGLSGAGDVADVAVDRVIEGTNRGAARYCSAPQSFRERMRDLQIERANEDPRTTGIVVRVTCPADAAAE